MAKSKRRTEPISAATELRIVGGRFRGSKLLYEPLRSGDELVTRPMKHRLREAIFNLIGPESEGCHAIDLFAGTGALGLEALSRGAVRATFIEKHVPTSRVIEQNIKTLGVDDQATLLVTSAFLWGKRDAAKGDADALPWLVFCSPPFDFFVDRCEDMVELIQNVMAAAPPESIVVVESDERFDFALLPEAVDEGQESTPWDVRVYAPAVVGVWRKMLN